MARLQAEPVVLAPRALAPNDGRRSLMALAAALAAVVGWLALAPQERDALPPAPVARAEQPAPPAKMAADVANNAAAGEMREYLAAHQAYAAGLQFQGGAQHIRTVSMALAR
jgi:hypothetical protein